MRVQAWRPRQQQLLAGAPSELPFGELSRVLMTPHSSGITRDTFVGRVDDIAANIGRLQRGEPLRNVVAH